MRVLVAHNFYQQPGGEDVVFQDEVELLRRNGHDVQTFTAHNDDLRHRGRLRQLVDSVWNRESARLLRERARAHRAEVVHFHNTFPILSPAAYTAARQAGAAVVQTLHNYRLICPGSLLYRDGKPCETCVGAVLPLAAVRHRCYRQSLSATAATAALLSIHRAARTWNRRVDAYVALSEFGRGKFIAGGLPAHKLHVKPNFLTADPTVGDGSGGYALYVGRLTDDKGVSTLLEAWRDPHLDLPLRIAGDGPLRGEVVAAAAANPRIAYLGPQSRDSVMALLRGAACLIFPSKWYEGQPRIVIESLASGTPVIGSRLGAIEETLRSCDPALLVEAGSERSLAEGVASFLSLSAQRRAATRMAARLAYEACHTADRNHAALLDIYRAAIEQSRQATRRSGSHDRRILPCL
jgi:glycosyltransferase involved in cell wall biosynthesis